jgi:putative transposase
MMEPTMEEGVELAGEARTPSGPVIKIDEGRTDMQAGSCDRHLHTKAGDVELLVPKLQTLPFETAIIDRYRRRESLVEEALTEMYLAGVSVRRVEDITQALWGTRASARTVHDLNQKVHGKIDDWRLRPLVGDFPYVFLDGLLLKRSWGSEVKSISVLVASGVAQSGYQKILAVSEGAKEDTANWTTFLRGLKERGLKGVELFVSDKCLGLAEFYPDALWQRCVVHFYRKVWTAVPTSKVREVAVMLKAIHAQEGAKAAEEEALQMVEKLRAMRLTKAADIVENGIGETLSYYAMPPEHWRYLRTKNPLDRLMRETRRRTWTVGAVPDGQLALMLVAARLRHVAATKWGTKRYLQMDRLAEVVAIG